MKSRCSTLLVRRMTLQVTQYRLFGLSIDLQLNDLGEKRLLLHGLGQKPEFHCDQYRIPASAVDDARDLVPFPAQPSDRRLAADPTLLSASKTHCSVMLSHILRVHLHAAGHRIVNEEY